MEVVLKNLTKRFGQVVAVDDLNLRVEDGIFLVLLGPSGCGKTTTLRLIAGLETPNSGEIYIGDELVNDLPPKDRNIAMVFQSYALYPHMSVFDNMALALKVKKIPKEEIDERVRAAAEILQIGDLLSRKPSQLSGGQRQRVALGRAIVRNPNVFLMDEPLSNLDAKLRVHMRAELKKLHQALKTTFIYVTHDQLEAMTLGSKIALLDKGVLQQLGTPDELYDHPTNQFVAGFVGTPAMNFQSGSVRERNGRLILDLGPIEFELTHQVASVVRQTSLSELTIGVRPEDIVVGEHGEYRATLDVIEPLGPEDLLHLKVGELSFVARVGRIRGLNPGNVVSFSIPEGRAHFFHDGQAVL